MASLPLYNLEYDVKKIKNIQTHAVDMPNAVLVDDKC